LANARNAVGGGRLSRTLVPAHLARRAALRWASSKLTWGETRARKRGEFVMRTARDVTETMGDMKGAIMKFGQILSLMSGMLPDEMTAELATLQRDAPPMAFNLVEDVFDRDFGASPHALFRHFDREPFAAASIGQVHRATTRDGRDVAVKVQCSTPASSRRSSTTLPTSA
jgi:predicted unusual protein kinase regulating ubiquinone biosynthesis (AarF/ABC1/UbiB family)